MNKALFVKSRALGVSGGKTGNYGLVTLDKLFNLYAHFYTFQLYLKYTTINLPHKPIRARLGHIFPISESL